MSKSEFLKKISNSTVHKAAGSLATGCSQEPPAGTPPTPGGHSCRKLPFTAYGTFFSGMLEQRNSTSQIMDWPGTVRPAAFGNKLEGEGKIESCSFLGEGNTWRNQIYLATISVYPLLDMIIVCLVTIPHLDLIMIHWIKWIQWNYFRKNPYIGTMYKNQIPSIISFSFQIFLWFHIFQDLKPI